jgi:hypothetical protein
MKIYIRQYSGPFATAPWRVHIWTLQKTGRYTFLGFNAESLAEAKIIIAREKSRGASSR